MMMLRSISLILMIFACCYINVQSSSARERITEREDEMVEKMLQSPTGMIEFTDKDFKKYVLPKYRNYESVVLFTASDARFKCTVCSDVEKEFAKVAYTYKKSVYNPDNKILFFIKVEYATSQKTFAKHGLSQVPIVAYMGDFSSRNPKQYTGKIEDIDSVEMKSFTAEMFAEFVEKKTGHHVEILRSALPKILVLVFLLLVGVVMAKPVFDNLESLKKLREYVSLWRAVSIGIYALSISGVVYDIIRSPPVFHCREGGCIFFHPQSGQQFVLEGFIIGGMNLACAAVVIYMYDYLPKVGLKSNRGRITIFLLLSFWVCYSLIISKYKTKSPWYPYSINPFL